MTRGPNWSARRLRYLLRSADEPFLLAPPAIEIRLSRPVSPPQIAQEEQKRHVARLAGQHGPRDDVEEQPCAGRCADGARFQVSSVMLSHSSARGAFQGASGGICANEASSTANRSAQFELAPGSQPRQVARVAGELAAPGEQLAAVVELRKSCRRPARRPGPARRFCVGPIHWPPRSIDVAAQRLAERPAADPIAGFEHHARLARAAPAPAPRTSRPGPRRRSPRQRVAKCSDRPGSCARLPIGCAGDSVHYAPPRRQRGLGRCCHAADAGVVFECR